MTDSTTTQILRRNIAYASAALVVTHIVGTLGFLALARQPVSTFDAFYMTFITVSTIGFSEVIDMSGNVPARLFTIGVAIVGIGSIWVMFSNVTALLLARSLDPVRQKQRLLKEISLMREHYIVCGAGRIGTGIIRELRTLGLRHVAIEPDPQAIERLRQQEGLEDVQVIAGDASDDAILASAGIAAARGLFAVSGDDARNILITLSGRHLNAALRIVARVHDVRNVEKCRRSGADEIVSPDFTGALRIASAMLRPEASGFIDELLHRSDAMRVIDVPLPADFVARPFGDLQLRAQEYLVIGLRSNGATAGTSEWLLNPGPDSQLRPGVVLIALATPVGLQELRRRLLTA